MSLAIIYLDSVKKRFQGYKELGDKTFAQLADADFYFQSNDSSNTIAQIIQHMSGNMLSRWTNFLSEDGEKSWRARDDEFEIHDFTRQQLIERWEEGWDCLLKALDALGEEDLEKTIHIRNEPLIVVDAINRQLAHYSYHIGQIAFIGKMLKDQGWKTLSIPKAPSKNKAERG